MTIIDEIRADREADDGGSAFPVSNGVDTDWGMTLRDWFAGQALAGIASISNDNFSLSPEDEAAWAYQRADAMIAARAKPSAWEEIADE